jgi:predicted metalloendopeptidase
LSHAWNYGALGSIIGHEICHGFDEDGRYFLPNGVKKNWWTRSDAGKYSRKIRGLEDMFSSEIVCGKHVDGSKTVSENIADLGGIAICVEALKESQRKRGLSPDAIKKEFREFFIAFATSWRTKYRKEKLKMFMTLDTHSPAFLRVNLVVSQLQEWYDAFDIKEGALYRKPEDRIVIF